MVRVHAVCPLCGRKLRKLEAFEVATSNVRRTCGGCRRRISVTIQPIAIEQGTTYVVTVAEARQIA